MVALPFGVRRDLRFVDAPDGFLARRGMPHCHTGVRAANLHPRTCGFLPRQSRYGAAFAVRHLDLFEVTEEEQEASFQLEPCEELLGGQLSRLQGDPKDRPLGPGDLLPQLGSGDGFQGETGVPHLKGVAVDLPGRGEGPEGRKSDAEAACAPGVGGLAAEPGHSQQQDVTEADRDAVVGDQEGVRAPQKAQLPGPRVVGVLHELGEHMQGVTIATWHPGRTEPLGTPGGATGLGPVGVDTPLVSAR